MDYDIDARINRLLNQLEQPDLEDYKVESIKDKIQFLQSLKEE